MDMISVVVPVYNGERYLEKCIESILQQTYPNIEVIIVNDGSTDGTENLCCKLEKVDSRVRCIHQENMGVTAARTHGIHNAKGEWITFVDSDDYLKKNNYFKESMERIRNDGTDLCVQMRQSIYKAESKEDTRIIGAEKALCELMRLRFPVSCCATIYHKSLLQGIKEYKDIVFFEDFLLNYQVLHRAKSASLTYDDIYHYTDNPQSANHLGLSGVRMTCLKIIPLISPGGELYDPDLAQDYKFVTAHFLYCNAIFLDGSENSRRYFKELRNTANMYMRDIHSGLVPVRYKIVLWMLLHSPLLLEFAVKIKRRRRTK